MSILHIIRTFAEINVAFDKVHFKRRKILKEDQNKTSKYEPCSWFHLGVYVETFVMLWWTKTYESISALPCHSPDVHTEWKQAGFNSCPKKPALLWLHLKKIPTKTTTPTTTLSLLKWEKTENRELWSSITIVSNASKCIEWDKQEVLLLYFVGERGTTEDIGWGVFGWTSLRSPPNCASSGSCGPAGILLDWTASPLNLQSNVTERELTRSFMAVGRRPKMKVTLRYGYQ